MQFFNELLCTFLCKEPKGLIGLCNQLRKLWASYPIYLAYKDCRAGINFHRLKPISDDAGIKILETSDDKVVNDRLYIMVGKKKNEPVSLFPMALLWDEDILFFNGASSYDKTMYLGYVNHHFGKKNSMMTSHLEDELCDYLAFFLGVPFLDTIDFSNAKLLAHAMDLKDSGWRFPDLRPGMKVGSKERAYELIEYVGEGGMAKVWKAVCINEKRTVALKFLLDIKNSIRFRREARAIEKVSKLTDRIVRFYDFQFDPNPHKQVSFLTIELLSGGSLEQIAKSDNPISYKKVCNWMEDVFNALEAIHNVGGVHRDIKPSNLLFDHKGSVKLCDLGLVGSINEKESDLVTTTGITRDGTAIGTFEFSSPEQLKGGKVGESVTIKSDLFSVGAAFYYLITKEFPYGSENQALISERHLKAKLPTEFAEKPRRVIELIDDCPKFIDQLIMSLIEVNPHFRPDLKTVLERLQEYRVSLKKSRKNVNFDPVGKTDDERVKFYALIPTWIHRYIFWIWPVLCAVEFSLVYIIAHKMGLFFPGTASSSIIPVLNDYAYLGFHIVPCLFIVLLYMRDRLRRT